MLLLDPLLFIFLCLFSIPVVGTSYYANSVFGNDNNSGKSSQLAFQTLGQCVSALKKPGDECVLATGRYIEPTVVIDGLSGSDNAHIVIRNGDGQTPQIDGTQPINAKWSPYEPIQVTNNRDHTNIWMATLENDIIQLFIDGDLMTNARWPNALWQDRTVFDRKYWATMSSKGSKYKPDGECTLQDDGSSDLAGSKINGTGAVAIMDIGSNFVYASIVDHHKPGDDSFTYTSHWGKLRKEKLDGGYILEDKLELLDQPGEWFFDKHSKRVYVALFDGGSPEKHEVRGRGAEQTYAINITNSNHITIEGLTFYATSLWAMGVEDLTFNSNQFLFSTYSRRMIGDCSIASPMVVSNTGFDYRYSRHRNDYVPRTISNSFLLFNNTWFGSDGVPIALEGTNCNIINNEWRYNDWSLCNEATGEGTTEPTFRSKGKSDYFVRNTFYGNGATSAYKPPNKNYIAFNHFSAQSSLGNDGSHVQCASGCQPGTIIEYNWAHDDTKYAFRWDGKGDGTDGVMRYNVAWKMGGIMVKSQNATTVNNLAMEMRKAGDRQGHGSLSVLPELNGKKINKNSITEANIADTASEPLPGRAKNNIIGVKAPWQQLRDPNNWDFRPKRNASCIAMNVGPYVSHKQVNTTHYWIPGRQYYKASVAIPQNGTRSAHTDTDLMFLQAYQTKQHMIYLGTNKTAIQNADLKSSEYKTTLHDGRNTFSPEKDLIVNTTYYWRVDAIDPNNKAIYKGDIWTFYTNTTASSNIFF